MFKSPHEKWLYYTDRSNKFAIVAVSPNGFRGDILTEQYWHFLKEKNKASCDGQDDRNWLVVVPVFHS